MLVFHLLSFFFDAATLVLIWMVQLVVYPSFAFFQKDDLKRWHQRYTGNISRIVVPLMIGQLVLGLYVAFSFPNAIALVKLVLVCGVWGLTFAIFVPLHNAIPTANEEETQLICRHLVKKNWSRTFVWTIIFILGTFQMVTSLQS